MINGSNDSRRDVHWEKFVTWKNEEIVQNLDQSNTDVPNLHRGIFQITVWLKELQKPILQSNTVWIQSSAIFHQNACAIAHRFWLFHHVSQKPIFQPLFACHILFRSPKTFINAHKIKQTMNKKILKKYGNTFHHQ